MVPLATNGTIGKITNGTIGKPRTEPVIWTQYGSIICMCISNESDQGFEFQITPDLGRKLMKSIAENLRHKYYMNSGNLSQFVFFW